MGWGDRAGKLVDEARGRQGDMGAGTMSTQKGEADRAWLAELFGDDAVPTPQQVRWAGQFVDLWARVNGAGAGAGKTWFWRRLVAYLRRAEPWAFTVPCVPVEGQRVWHGIVIDESAGDRVVVVLDAEVVPRALLGKRVQVVIE